MALDDETLDDAPRFTTPGDSQSVDHDPDADAYWTEFDPGREPPSEAVVRTVAAAADRSPLTLTPLYDAVEPDALNALVGHGGAERTTWLTFVYCGYHVTVRGDGVVSLTPVSGSGT